MERVAEFCASAVLHGRNILLMLMVPSCSPKTSLKVVCMLHNVLLHFLSLFWSSSLYPGFLYEKSIYWVKQIAYRPGERTGETAVTAIWAGERKLGVAGALQTQYKLWLLVSYVSTTLQGYPGVKTSFQISLLTKWSKSFLCFFGWFFLRVWTDEWEDLYRGKWLVNKQ